jgi:cobalt-zinc-cadmium efflux system membrane fusion protein
MIIMVYHSTRAARAILMALPLLLLFACGPESQEKQQSRIAEAPPSVADQQAPRPQTVTLEEGQARDLGIETLRLRRQLLKYTIEAPGVVFPAPENISVVSAPVNGRIVSITAHEGERVRKGQVLLTLESLEFSNLLAEFIQARSELSYQESQRERVTLLVEKKISPKSALDKVQADYDRADASHRAALSRLMAVGVTQEEVDAWRTDNTLNPHLPMYAPISGSIAEHLIDLGQAVTAYQKLLTIVDLRQVKVEGYVSPEDGGAIQAGDSVDISLKDDPDRLIRTRVTSVNPTLDERSRAITVYIIVPTRDGWPKPGENVRLRISATTSAPVIGIPASALVYDGTTPTVFVRRDSLSFEKRPVRLARSSGEFSIVREGLTEGEQIAVSQLFTLKALSRFEQFAEE